MSQSETVMFTSENGQGEKTHSSRRRNAGDAFYIKAQCQKRSMDNNIRTFAPTVQKKEKKNNVSTSDKIVKDESNDRQECSQDSMIDFLACRGCNTADHTKQPVGECIERGDWNDVERGKLPAEKCRHIIEILVTTYI
ncbi:hypothetical protein CHS0354_021168 [Potamilus streckersoni]|uniref:Uncharacterized protein n=1 Tax=Potamilus streckersoni TaxID=2493646 RepID=A0AAE0S2M5_9BIVA|nr:hypothetical protein CHS0354_021168 [Potamilus streckersoni]